MGRYLPLGKTADDLATADRMLGVDYGELQSRWNRTEARDPGRHPVTTQEHLDDVANSRLGGPPITDEQITAVRYRTDADFTADHRRVLAMADERTRTATNERLAQNFGRRDFISNTGRGIR